MRVRWPGREADHLPPSSAEISNDWTYTSALTSVFLAWYALPTSTSPTLSNLLIFRLMPCNPPGLL